MTVQQELDAMRDLLAKRGWVREGGDYSEEWRRTVLDEYEYILLSRTIYDEEPLQWLHEPTRDSGRIWQVNTGLHTLRDHINQLPR